MAPAPHRTQGPPRVLLAGGGTGGHVYPAIAIADAIRNLDEEAALMFAGTRERMEWDAVPRAGYSIFPIRVSGLHRELSRRTLQFPLKLVQGFADSRRLVSDFDADVAVGTGGYVSGPVLMAASMRGVPIVIQEQNAYAGLTNRMLGRRAERVHVAFAEAEQYFPPSRCRLSGNPTRMELLKADPAEARVHFQVPSDARVLLVFGGSLGSSAINDAVERLLPGLLYQEDRFVIWQSGARYYEALSQRIDEHPRLRLLRYLDRMDLAYAVAELAVCRAGAITCSELMVTGTPAILVPSPNVAADHQTKNAKSMRQAGAADLLPESGLEAQLVPRVDDLMNDAGTRASMAAAARAMARPDAARDIATDVLEVARQAGHRRRVQT